MIVKIKDKESIQWAIDTIDIHPTLWSRKFSATPVMILKKWGKEICDGGLDYKSSLTENDGFPSYFDAAH